jgi:ribosomal protein S18 acetylase RimI-like enzyme
LKTIRKIREMNHHDLSLVKTIIDANNMFPSEYLDDMVKPYFEEQSDEKWLVVTNEHEDVIGVAYFTPEKMTEGTWNLLLIAIKPQHQGAGIGGMLMAKVEEILSALKVRVLLVETSGLPDYALTREFYPKQGYTQVAVIPEYYDKADDKVVFWKRLCE